MRAHPSSPSCRAPLNASMVLGVRPETLHATHSERDVYPVVLDLYREARTRHRPIRLLGLKLSNLGFFDEQLELFDGAAPLHRAVDDVRARFGFDAIRSAAALKKR